MRDSIPYVNIHTHRDVECEETIRTIGLHPWSAADDDLQLISINDIDSSIQAIGEIGLDFSTDVDRELQERLFMEQLSLAHLKRLPVVIHSVRSFERVIELLKMFRIKSVIFHGFIGSKEQMQQAIKLDYYISFGHRTFSSPKTIEALKAAPLDKIFFETDLHPIAIEELYAEASKFRQESMEEIKETIYKNYTNIFEQ